MTFARAKNVSLLIPRSALEAVFDECDRYDADETGGRVLGTYEMRGGELTIRVSGIIEPGPNADRTATYFKQDGEYQERVFREVEDREPSVEHLGNWHTHHVNGLRHLSGGDIATYERTVNHRNHNTDFFYALLVIERKGGKGLERYIFKNYLLRRGDPEVYEIPASALRLIDSPLIWPSATPPPTRLVAPPPSHVETAPADDDVLRRNRVCDRDFAAEFYPKLAPFQSKELGVYWRGPIPLIDGSSLEVVVLEDASGSMPTYRINLREFPEFLADISKKLSSRDFSSCRAALLTAERMCNLELYETHPKKKRDKRRWMF